MIVRASLLLATLVLAGCAVGPDYRPPALPATTAAFVASRADLGAADALPPEWWRLYDDARLDALIGEAIAANTDLRAAEANLRGAAAVLQAVRAARLPSTQVQGSATYGRDGLNDALYGAAGLPAPDDWIETGRIGVSYQLDLFGQVRRGIEAARADAGAAVAARDVVRVTVVAQTAAAYADMCALGQSVDVAQRSLDLAREIARTTQVRAAAGVDTNFDRARSEALVAQTAAAVPPIEGQRRAQMFVLAALLGKTPAAMAAEQLDCRTPLRLKAPIPVGDGAALLRRRPDLRLAERALAASTARIGVATAALYPTVSLGGSFGWLGDSLGDVTPHDAISFGVGPLISWNFPNQSVARARIRQARAGAEAALAQFDGVVVKALSETEQALTAYGAELDRHRQLAEARSRSAEAVRLAEIERREGALGYLDLLTAEQTLISADAALAASDRALSADQIAVFKALGGGWQQP